jgi:N-acetylglucosamine-6-phosphate deacetylase
MQKQRSAVSGQQSAPLPPFNSPLSKGGYRGVKGGRVREGVKAPSSKPRIQNSNPSKIIGIHLEGPFLNPSRGGALNAMAFIEPTEKILRELLEGFEDIVKIITISPELQGALQIIKKVSDMGIIVSMGHSDATFSEAEAGFNAGARGITHIFNAMRSFHHREPGIAGFGLINKDIYIEVIADPFHLHPKTLELIFKTKNPEKIIIVSDTVKETKGGGDEGKEQGMVQAVTDTHGRLLGGSMTIVESSKRLIQMGFDEIVVMGCITTNPEKLLKGT